MLSLSAKTRKISGKKVNTLRKESVLPAILYGPKIKPIPLEVNLKEFEEVLEEAGESSLISLEIAKGEKFLVLIHSIEKDQLTEKPTHADFYQPKLENEVEVTIPVVFEGESRAMKDLGGTLVKNILELKVKAKPQNLPKEIRVNIEKINTFDDNILIKDLKIPEGVKIIRDPQEVVALVVPLERIEEELEKPIEEKVEEIEKVEKKKEERVELGTEEGKGEENKGGN